MELTVKLQVFEGPLDLLLHLLEKNKKAYGNKKTYDKQYVHAPDSETYLAEFLKWLQKNA